MKREELTSGEVLGKSVARVDALAASLCSGWLKSIRLGTAVFPIGMFPAECG